MKYYITKYAITKGIQEIDSDDMVQDPRSSGTLLMVTGPKGYPRVFHKDEWFTDRAEAIKNAELRKSRKLAALKKQISTLEKLVFE